MELTFILKHVLKVNETSHYFFFHFPATPIQISLFFYRHALIAVHIDISFFFLFFVKKNLFIDCFRLDSISRVPSNFVQCLRCPYLCTQFLLIESSFFFIFLRKLINFFFHLES